MVHRAEVLENQFARHYTNYQYAFVDFFLENISDLSRSFRGDLNQMMLLAIVGQRHLFALRTAGGDLSLVSPDQTAITASRLADICGMSRETVRRKLGLLKKKGWIMQNADGAWHIVADPTGQDLPVRHDLADLDRRVRQRAARLFAQLEVLDRKPRS
jgi:hypothetical protein